jgi:O-antigen/teichoic acid export membrane protein
MLVKRTFQFWPAQILGPLAQFSSVVIWTHFCSSSTVGILTLLAVFQELANKIAFSWWNHYTLRYYNENQDDKNWMSSDGFVIMLTCFQVLMSFFFLECWFGIDYHLEFYLLAAIYMGLRSLTQFFATLSSIRGNVIQFNLYSVLGPVLGLVIGVIFLFFYGDNPVYPIVGYIVGELIAVIVYYRNNLFINTMISKDIINSAFSYSGPLLVAGVLYWIGAHGTRIIIEWKFDLAAVGQFAVGFGLGQRAASLVAMLVTPASLPLAMNKMRDKGRKAAMEQLSDNFALLLIIMLPAMAGLYMISGDLIPLIIAPEFQQSSQLIFPISLISGGFFAVIYNYCNHYFLVISHTKPLMLIEFVLALLVCGLAYCLIDYYGIYGGALAMLIAAGGVAFVLCIYLTMVKDLKFPVCTALISVMSVAIMCLILHYISIKIVAINVYFILGLKIFSSILIYTALIYPFFKKRLLFKLS